CVTKPLLPLDILLPSIRFPYTVKVIEQPMARSGVLHTSTTTSSCQDHALEDSQIRGGRARDMLGIDRAVRGPREGNIDEYWWRIYESGNLEVLES
ncbi:hypothetical protein Tco_1369438, partial [Tanacetum coccineum]